MYAFQGGAGHQCVRPGNLEKPCRFDQQKRPEPLAAAEARIAHSFYEARGTVQLAVNNEPNPIVLTLRPDGSLSGPGYESLRAAMQEAYGHEQTTEGQGGSIPLCNVFAETFPDAEIMLMGVEEPRCLIHAPNESVDPSEIEHLALAEALFLEKYAAAAR